MERFFDYQSPLRMSDPISLNYIEYWFPFIVLIGFIWLIYVNRNVIKNNKKLDTIIRIISSVVFSFIYLSHYILRFSLYKYDPINLPLHLCSISMFLAIILLITKNRTIFTFVLYTGIIGGFISLFTPLIGYNSMYYRYYQFYIGHILLITTPLYFMFVHGFYPTKKTTTLSFVFLNLIAISVGFFNYFNQTDFMFLWVTKDKMLDYPILKYFGGVPYYLIVVELVAVITFYGLFKLAKLTQYIITKDLHLNRV